MTYSVMFEPSVKLDQIYPTRSSPLNSMIYRHRQIALKQALLPSNNAFQQKVRTEIAAAKTYATVEKTNPAVVAQLSQLEANEGETLFLEEYVPFGMGELCGDIMGADGEDAVKGLHVDQEQLVAEMEQKYAADGLFI